MIRQNNTCSVILSDNMHKRHYTINYIAETSKRPFPCNAISNLPLFDTVRYDESDFEDGTVTEYDEGNNDISVNSSIFAISHIKCIINKNTESQHSGNITALSSGYCRCVISQ